MLSLAAVIKIMVRFAVLFSFAIPVYAGVVELPHRAVEKVIISVPEAVLSVQATSSSNLSLRLREGADEEYTVLNQNGVLRIEPKVAPTRESWGRFAAKKRLIEIQGPAVPLEVHAFEGQVSLTGWGREALIHVQKGRIQSREGAGALKIHSMSGDIQVLGHQGPLTVDTYKASLVVRNLSGDAELENFAGETQVDGARGFLSMNQGQGSSKIQGSSGTLQFELAKGSLNIQNFAGRVEGQTQEGPVNVTMAAETDVNIRSDNGRVTVQTPSNSGAQLNLASTEGDIMVPQYLRVSRDGGQKVLRGRMKGDEAKGNVMVRSQEGAIVVR